MINRTKDKCFLLKKVFEVLNRFIQILQFWVSEQQALFFYDFLINLNTYRLRCMNVYV